MVTLILNIYESVGLAPFFFLMEYFLNLAIWLVSGGRNCYGFFGLLLCFLRFKIFFLFYLFFIFYFYYYFFNGIEVEGAVA